MRPFVLTVGTVLGPQRTHPFILTVGTTLRSMQRHHSSSWLTRQKHQATLLTRNLPIAHRARPNRIVRRSFGSCLPPLRSVVCDRAPPVSWISSTGRSASCDAATTPAGYEPRSYAVRVASRSARITVDTPNIRSPYRRSRPESRGLAIFKRVCQAFPACCYTLSVEGAARRPAG
jgi:hypothetical protein